MTGAAGCRARRARVRARPGRRSGAGAAEEVVGVMKPTWAAEPSDFAAGAPPSISALTDSTCSGRNVQALSFRCPSRAERVCDYLPHLLPVVRMVRISRKKEIELGVVLLARKNPARGGTAQDAGSSATASTVTQRSPLLELRTVSPDEGGGFVLHKRTHARCQPMNRSSNAATRQK